jgi:hypothetical protein
MTKLISIWKKYRLVFLVFLILVALNYNPQLLFESNYRHWGWNFSLLGTILILLVIRHRDPETWRQKLGINFSNSDWLGFVLITAGLLVISFLLVDHLTLESGYSFKPRLLYFREYFGTSARLFPILGDYLYYFPETFNEEILIGALLLMGLQRKFPKLNNNIIVIGVALLFSLMHQAMYKWSPAQPDILLSIPTILSLLFVGVLRNALILKTRKIAIAWAIHLSFNLIFFPGFFVHLETTGFAGEAERFNIVFGNLTMALATGILAIGAMIWLNLHHESTSTETLE